MTLIARSDRVWILISRSLVRVVARPVVEDVQPLRAFAGLVAQAVDFGVARLIAIPVRPVVLASILVHERSLHP